MRDKGFFPRATRIIGIVITAWIVFLVAFDVIKQLKKGLESFSRSFSDLFLQQFPYVDPNVLIWIYLVGYAIVWRKKLLGSTIIIVISVYGMIISQAGDVMFHFILTFLVGLLYFALYLTQQYNKRTSKNT